MIKSTIEFVLSNLPAILFVAAFALAAVTRSSKLFSCSASEMAASLGRYRVHVGWLLSHCVSAYSSFEHRLGG